MSKVQPITERRFSKGGQNEPYNGGPRPPAPGPNGNSGNARKAQEVVDVEVLSIGSKVSVGDDIDATVVGVCIYRSGVEYQIVWWDGRTRKCEWVKSAEIDPVATHKTRIGFIPQQGEVQ